MGESSNRKPIERVFCVGVSHRTADVAYREKLGDDLAARCARLAAPGGTPGNAREVREVAWLSTCHRVEAYAVLDGGDEPRADPLLALLAGAHDLAPADVAAHAYAHRGRDAVRHLCCVAAGLDSMILGEPQVLGQVGDALKSAQAVGTIGPILSAVFRGAIRAGRQARIETAIGASPATTSAVAIALARGVVGPLEERRVLVIGLGEMGSITVGALRARRVRDVAVTNRTPARAHEVAARYGVRAFSMDEIPDALAWADVVVSATSAPHVIVDPAAVEAAIPRRDGRPLLFVDMAVPRDVDPAVRYLPGVHLFDADDLSGTLEDGLASRQTAISHVEDIIERRLALIDEELSDMTARPLIRDLHRRAEAIRRQELENALRHMGDVDGTTKEHLNLLSRSIVKRLLRRPTERLEETARDEHWDDTARTVRRLFDL